MSKKTKLMVICLFFILCLFSFSFAQQESMTITTYYPSPYGSYKELRSQKIAIGSTYYDSASHPWNESGVCFSDQICNADLVVEGNVGIGTRSPDGLLSLGNSTGKAKLLVYDGGTGNNLYTGFGIDQPAANDFTMYAHNNGRLKFGKIGTDFSTITPWMTIDNSGNVGIGTTTIASGTFGATPKLLVSAATGANGYVFIDSPDQTGYAFRTAGVDQWGITSRGTADTPNNRLAIYRAIPSVTEVFTILQNGNVGIGTTNPYVQLVVRGAGDSYGNAIGIIDTDSAVQNWLLVAKQNGDFSIHQSGQADRITVQNGGNVGIGTTSPPVKVEINKTSQSYPTLGTAAGNLFLSSGGNQWGMFLGLDDNGGGWIQQMRRDSATAYNLSLQPVGGKVGIGTTSPGYTLSVAGTIWANGAAITAGATTWSDVRLKENIEPINNSLDRIERLNGVYYDWKEAEFTKNFPKGRQIGIIAQEMEKEFPELVSTDKQGYKAIAYDRFTAVLLEAIKAQQQQIELLKAEIANLKKKASSTS